MHCVQCYCEPVSLISLSKFELAPTPDEFVINCCPRKAEEFFYCVFSDEILWLTDVSVFFSSSSSLWQQKGRRGKVFGKVNCKNIKQDCPDLDCDDPVLLPGHCCKTCPKGNNLPTQSKHLLMLFFLMFSK